MSYDFKNVKNQRLAKERLEQALKRVKASDKYKEGKFSADAYSRVAQSVVPHLKKNSMKGLHIYEADNWGWHADLELRGMPPGVSRILGTPVAMPCKTREEAEAFGDHLIGAILSVIESGTRTPLDPAMRDGKATAFEFHGASFELQIEMLQSLKEMGLVPEESYVVERLKDMEGLYLTDGEFDSGKWEADTEEARLTFIAVLAQAAVRGFFRWPKRQAPSASETRH